MARTRTVFLSVSLVVVLLVAGMLTASRHTEEELFKAMGNLAEVVHLVTTEYVDELNQNALALSLDAGLVESVDPWAAVLPAESVDAYRQLLGSPPPFGLGLGIRLSSAAVRHTVAGSPAAAAGLETWEVIELIDGVNTRGRPLWQIRLELMEREVKGESVKLTVVDRLVDDRREVVLEPESWLPDAVTVDDSEGVQVVQVVCLPKGASGDVGRLVGRDSPVVLDLRELVWGVEEEAIATASLFVDDGMLGMWRGRRAGEESFEATAGTVSDQLPVVVVDNNTEGVGEILAAALQRAGATVVGGPTIGHAPHMRLVEDGDLYMWLPVAYWLRSDGEPITGNGVDPDELVERDADDDEGDPLLERALELVRVELAKAA